MKGLICGIFLASVVAVASGNAYGQTLTLHTWHGTVCQPLAAFAGLVEYSQYGISNSSTTTTVTVECPLPLNFFYGTTGVEVVDWVSFGAYDRNTSLDVACSLRALNGDGSVRVSVSGQTVGAYVAATFIPLNPPVNTLANAHWDVLCTIPPMDTGGASFVTSFKMQTEHP